MKKTYWKETLRDIGRSKGRFFALIAIVALGSGFFGGIKATSIDMKMTVDQYYKQNNLMDFRLVSTLGITDGDAAAIASLDGVRDVMPSYRLDAIIAKSSREEDSIESDSVFRLHSLPTDGGGINRTVLKEGRMPEKKDEALLLASKAVNNGYGIGDAVKINADVDEDAADQLNTTEFTIVGIVDSPLYMSIERGSTSKGSGTINSYLFVPEDAFNMEAYTELYLTADGSAQLASYADEYDKMADSLQKKLEDIGVERCEIRRTEVIDEATEKLADAKKEYEEKKAETEEKLADAQTKLIDASKEVADGEKKLKDSEKKLIDGEKELADQKRKFADSVADAQKQINDGWEKIGDARAELIQGKEKLDEKKAELEDGKKAYERGAQELAKGRAEYESGRQAFDQQAAQAAATIAYLESTITPETPPEAAAATRAAIQKIKDGLAAGKQQLDEAKAKLEAGEKQLSDSAAQIHEGEAAIRDAEKTIADGEREISEKTDELNEKTDEFQKEKADAEKKISEGEKELADGRKELADGKKKISDAKAELSDAQTKYNESKSEADQKLSDAHEKILDAEEKIADIETPDWYVLGRDTISGYTSFYQDTERIDAIAMVFPVFFFLVAALVCLTTMTRMIEEQRTQIGVLKALGYSKSMIISKYIFYAAFTSLAGSLIGLTVGFQVFPRVIWAAYGMMYTTPPILAPWNVPYSLIASLVFLVCTIGSTFLACYGELMSVPASLIRPKPPKSGKRILLERIPFLWKRLSFTQKLTARNILRYKKRFFMTVIGIAGCTALMLTGFGLKDSISGIVSNQFGNIFHYDMQGSFSHEITPGQESERQQKAINALRNDKRIKETLLIHQENSTARSGENGRSLPVYVLVPENTETVTDFITLQTRKGKTPISFPEKGAVITEKLSNELNLKVGDSLTLEDSDNRQVSIPIVGVCENYVHHYVYLSPAQYEALYEKPCTYQAFFSLLNETGEKVESELSAELLKNDEMIGVGFISSITQTFNDMFDSLNLVVLVLIISASLLAFVVLYNLTSINVNERVREIATIKVLGFYDREVDSYIYRENVVLTIIGILTGFAMGVFLHQYVMRVAEVNIVMFGREIYGPSYLWAALLTFVFSLTVNFVMHFRLKRISMVESLKSIE